MVYPWDHELLKCGKQNEKSRPSIAAQWTSKKVEDAACAIVDLQSEIRAEIYELAAIELEIGRAINQAVTDPTLNALLEMRYLKYLKWEEIAVRLDITFRWTMTLHKKALTIFTESALIHA